MTWRCAFGVGLVAAVSAIGWAGTASALYSSRDRETVPRGGNHMRSTTILAAAAAVLLATSLPAAAEMIRYQATVSPSSEAFRADISDRTTGHRAEKSCETT